MPTQTRLPLTDRLANVSEILISFASSPVLSHYYQVLADFTRFTIHYDFLGIALVDPTESAYIIHSLDAKIEEIEELIEFESINKGIIGDVIQTGKVARLQDALSNRPDSAFQFLSANYSLSNQLFIPLVQVEQTIGALIFAAGDELIYNEDDERVGVLLAAGLAANFEMARLYQGMADEQAMFHSMLQSANDGFVLVDPNLIVQYSNPAFHNMFGIEKAVKSEFLSDLFFEHPFIKLFQDDEVDQLELELEDGRIVQAVRHTIISGYGDHLGWAAALHDITLLRELVSMKTDFVNTVSHDLKNPLASIRMAADMIPIVGETNQAQKDMQDRIVRASVFMKELVTELLDIGQLESNLGLKVQELDLTQQLEDVIFAQKTPAESKNITLISEFEPNTLIHGDPGRLRQLFLNLVGNAVKYTPENGEVSVQLARLNNNQIQVEIKDTGLGIPADDLPHIFDKFYRVRTEDRANIKGTGLGLAITKSIVEAHAGEITVESEVNRGTTFRIVLPVNQPEN